MSDIADQFLIGMPKIKDGEYKNLSTMGVPRFLGNITVSKLLTVGINSIIGRLKCEEIECMGITRVKEKLEIHSIKNVGRCRFTNVLDSYKVENIGFLYAQEGIETEFFESTGGFKVNGLLNAGEIKIDINLPSSAEEIGGDHICIKQENRAWKFNLINRLLFWNWSIKKPVLKCAAIEGTDISLEYTYAGLVRGNKVRIGPGCKIKQVEYADELHTDTKSSINNIVRL